ncbi:hypothetical protein SprV_0501762000 [Sparganum proliferum]
MGIIANLKQPKDPTVLRALNGYLRFNNKLVEAKAMAKFIKECIERNEYPNHYWRALRRSRTILTAETPKRYAENQLERTLLKIEELKHQVCQRTAVLDTLTDEERQEFDNYTQSIGRKREEARSSALLRSVHEMKPQSRFPKDPSQLFIQPLFASHAVSSFHPIRALTFNLTVNAPVLYPNYLTSDRRRLITSSDSTSQPIAGIHTFDLPSVWLGDIALWLRTVESRFAHRQTTREDTKFYYVVAALPMYIVTDLRDIIDCPPTEAPYTALKEALIARISLSTQKRLQRLISEEDLGDRKPTQLLRRLEQLAEEQKLDGSLIIIIVIIIFKQLFLQRLPPSVQAILAPNIPSSTVLMLAETADRILEY